MTLIAYTLAFALIGLCTGLVARRYMPGGDAADYRAHSLIGVAGSISGGLFWLWLRWRSWAAGGGSAGWGPEGSAYAGADSAQTQLPGYWLGLLAAPITALLALAVYKLLKGSRDPV